MITENSLGQKINNPENFWKWFGNSITIDEQGRPRVFYHGTRSDFTEFQSSYSDKLIFFSYEKKFADDWGKSKKGYSNELSNEIFDKVRVFQNNLFKEYQAKYGEEFYIENEEMYKQYHKDVDAYEEELEKERNVHSRTLGCYLKVTKLFIPERDSNLVLDEIIKYYHWESKLDLDDKIKKAKNAFDKVDNEFDEWWKNNKNATDGEKKEQNKKLDIAYHAMFSLKNEKAQFDYDLKRIKQGAWIYFEHGNVIDKIYELGYDGIQLSEAGGKQTTIAVRTGRNQIKSVDNKGEYNSSENIYEDFNDNFYKWFGNSEVVDKNGRPLKVYHGTDVEFNVFNKPYGFMGNYFTDNKENAKYFSEYGFHPENSRIMTCYLKIENPYKIYADGSTWQELQIRGLGKQIKKVENSKEYDGIIIYDIKEGTNGNLPISTDYIVFNSNQIKSVNNKGTWSSDTENIYEDFISTNNLLIIKDENQLLNYLKEKKKSQKIIYDSKKDWYIVSYNTIISYDDLIKYAYNLGYYKNIDIQEYINNGINKIDKTIQPKYLFLFYYSPQESLQKSIFKEMTYGYVYKNFGSIYTRGFEINRILDLGKPIELKEDYNTYNQNIYIILNGELRKYL